MAAGCKNCFEFHLEEARLQGITDEEIVRAMNIGLDTRERAQAIAKEHGLTVLGHKLTQLVSRTGKDDEGRESDVPLGTRLEELTALASAFAVNCETSLEQRVAHARTAGATDEDIGGAIEISRFIKREADSLCCKRL